MTKRLDHSANKVVSSNMPGTAVSRVGSATIYWDAPTANALGRVQLDDVLAACERRLQDFSDTELGGRETQDALYQLAKAREAVEQITKAYQSRRSETPDRKPLG